MLIIKAYVNERQIDEICIQNHRIIDPDHPQGLCEYRIIKPEGDYQPIYHRREDGWMKLTLAAMGRILRNNMSVKRDTLMNK